MTKSSRDANMHRPGWVVAAWIAVLVTMFCVGNPSTAAAFAPETSVGAPVLDAPVTAGLYRGIDSGRRRGISHSTYDSALVAGVAEGDAIDRRLAPECSYDGAGPVYDALVRFVDVRTVVQFETVGRDTTAVSLGTQSGALSDGSVSVSGSGVAAEGVTNEGIYVVRSEAGAYVGQSGNITTRLGQHVANGKFTQAEVDAPERIAVSGGKTAREVAEQLKLDELGGRDGPGILNMVNPTGSRRVDLMPDGYSR